MKIVPIPAFNDNYIWLIHDDESAVCVDAIVLTHHHNDHIGGVAALQAANPDLAVYGPDDIDCVNHALKEGQELNLLGHGWLRLVFPARWTRSKTPAKPSGVPSGCCMWPMAGMRAVKCNCVPCCAQRRVCSRTMHRALMPMARQPVHCAST